MTIQYLSVIPGIKLANGEYSTANHKSSGTSALTGTAGVFFDDALVTNLNQLKNAVDHAFARASQLGLAKG